MTLLDSSVYSGGFFNGRYHGTGTFDDVENGQFSSGEFENGVIHGEGEMIYADGSRYRGEFSYGKRHGKGELYDKHSCERYIGAWKDDAMHGKGVQRSRRRSNPSREGTYEGDFFNGKRSGNGKVIYKGGTSIEGQWLDDEPRDGDWTIKFPDESTFYGFATFDHSSETSSDDGSDSKCESSKPLRVPLPHGFGTLAYPNGDKFTGEFADGVPIRQA